MGFRKFVHTLWILILKEFWVAWCLEGIFVLWAIRNLIKMDWSFQGMSKIWLASSGVLADDGKSRTPSAPNNAFITINNFPFPYKLYSQKSWFAALLPLYSAHLMCLLLILAFKHLKKGYLIMYNLVQFLGFSWIFVNMTVRLFILGKGK